MKWMVILLLLLPIANAKVITFYAQNSQTVDYRERISLPHIYPGQTVTSGNKFLEDPLRPGSSTARWTSKAAYSINLDKVHLMRKDFVLIIKSKKGPEIRILPFETTKIYLEPDYFPIKYEKETQTVWLAKYAS